MLIGIQRPFLILLILTITSVGYSQPSQNLVELWKVIDMAQDAIVKGNLSEATKQFDKAKKLAKTKSEIRELEELATELVIAVLRSGDEAKAYQIQSGNLANAIKFGNKDDIQSHRLFTARVAIRAGEHAKATELLNIALANEKSPDLKAKIFTFMGINSQAQKNNKDAIKWYTKARKSFLEDNEFVLAANKLHDIGNIYNSHFSDHAKAIQYYNLAGKELKAQNEDALFLQVQIDVGNSMLAMGSTIEAIAHIEKNIKSNPSGGLNWIRLTQNLANAYFRRGMIERAESLGQEIMGHTAKLEDPTFRALSEIDAKSIQALAMIETGRIKEGLQELNQSMTTANKYKLTRKQVLLHNNIGYGMRLSRDYKTALVHYNKALRIDQSEKYKTGLAFDFRNIGLVYLEMGRLKEAESSLKKSLQFGPAKNNPYNTAVSYLGLADIFSIQKKWSEAHSYYMKTIDIAQRSDYQSVLWRGLSGAAIALESLGDSKLSREYFEKSLAHIETLEKSYLSKKFRKHFKESKEVQDVFRRFESMLKKSGDLDEAAKIKARTDL